MCVCGGGGGGGVMFVRGTSMHTVTSTVLGFLSTCGYWDRIVTMGACIISPFPKI